MPSWSCLIIPLRGHGETATVGSAPWRTVAMIGLVMLGVLTVGAAPAWATHAYRCSCTGTDDPTVDGALCLPHQAWDGVSGGHPESALCAVQDTLGVDNVKDCQATP